jgi:hypothetical protein
VNAFFHISNGRQVSPVLVESKEKQLSLSFPPNDVDPLITEDLKKFKVGSYVSWINEWGTKQFGLIINLWWEKENYHFARVYSVNDNIEIRMLSHFKLEENLSNE